MEASKNPLSLSDTELVNQICREAVTGSREGGTTLKAYRHFSSLGFSRLRRTSKFTPLGDIEKQETAYLAAGLFLKAVLNGSYQPLDGIASEAYFWTICHRRAIDALRKLSLGDRSEEPTAPNFPNESEQLPGKSAFVRQISLDDNYSILSAATSENEQITAFLDREIVWKAVRQKLGDACFQVVYATIAEDRKNENVWEELGYANPDSFKTRKSKCMAELKKFIRPYFTH